MVFFLSSVHGCEQLMYIQMSGIKALKWFPTSLETLVHSFKILIHNLIVLSILKKCRVKIFNRQCESGHCHLLWRGKPLL